MSADAGPDGVGGFILSQSRTAFNRLAFHYFAFFGVQDQAVRRCRRRDAAVRQAGKAVALARLCCINPGRNDFKAGAGQLDKLRQAAPAGRGSGLACNVSGNPVSSSDDAPQQPHAPEPRQRSSRCYTMAAVAAR